MSRKSFTHEVCDRCGKTSEYSSGLSPIGMVKVSFAIVTRERDFSRDQEWCGECIGKFPVAQYLKRDPAGAEYVAEPPLPQESFEDMLREFIVGIIDEERPS